MKFTEATVAIVNKQINIKGSGGEVINTASTICNISHDDATALGGTITYIQHIDK